MVKVFLSHSSNDKATARQIALDLQMSNIGVWFDEWEIRVGDPIAQKVSRGLGDCDLIVVLLSKASVGSGWVEKEWGSRIGREASSKRVFILPVMLEDCSVPPLLEEKRYADLRQDRAAGFRELVEAILHHASDSQVVGPGARIRSGRIVFEASEPDLAILNGMITTIEEGCFVRQDGALQVCVRTVGSRQDVQEFMDRTGMNRLTLKSEDFVISKDAKRPSRFEGTGAVVIPPNHELTDFGTGQVFAFPFELRGDFAVRVDVHASDGRIAGRFDQVVTYAEPFPIPQLHAWGTFWATVDVG